MPEMVMSNGHGAEEMTRWNSLTRSAPPESQVSLLKDGIPLIPKPLNQILVNLTRILFLLTFGNMD
jgi:hypothetical protein